MSLSRHLGALAVVIFLPVTVQAQVYTNVIPGTKTGGSANIHVLGHIPLDAQGHTADITGLPDTTKVKELARIHLPDLPGGFHESYGYKHSNGAALLLTTIQGPWTHIYDIDKVVAGGDPNQGLIGRIPLPGDIKPGPS